MSGGPYGGPRKPSTRWSDYGRGSWGPYWDALFGPATVTGWVNWKRGSAGVNVARRLWAQREHLRRGYEAVHGSDVARWPSSHPGVLLDEVFSGVDAACLRCHYFEAHHSPGRALAGARRHEFSDGTYRPGADQPGAGQPGGPGTDREGTR